MSRSVNKVVLPKPAGAQIRVSLRPIPSLTRSTRRGRATRARACGMYSLVVRSWLATTPSLQVKRKRFETLTGDYTWLLEALFSYIRRSSGRMPRTGGNGCCFGGLGWGVPGEKHIEGANFVELRKAEVQLRRNYLPRTRVNKSVRQ